MSDKLKSEFLELSKKYEQLKSELKEVVKSLEATMKEIEIGQYFQDDVTKAVYKIVAPKGTFVSFKEIDYERTALEGESRGSLSKKEAAEKGFEV